MSWFGYSHQLRPNRLITPVGAPSASLLVSPALGGMTEGSQHLSTTAHPAPAARRRCPQRPPKPRQRGHRAGGYPLATHLAGHPIFFFSLNLWGLGWGFFPSLKSSHFPMITTVAHLRVRPRGDIPQDTLTSSRSSPIARKEQRNGRGQVLPQFPLQPG